MYKEAKAELHVIGHCSDTGMRREIMGERPERVCGAFSQVSDILMDRCKIAVSTISL